MMRIVLDTNIIVSGLFWRGSPYLILDAALNKRYISLATEPLLEEIRDVLSREKFAQKLAEKKLTVDGIVNSFRMIAIIVEPAEIPLDAIRDPKDRAVLACAVGGKADYIVSGDQDLLALTAYQNIPILDTAQFVKRLEE